MINGSCSFPAKGTSVNNLHLAALEAGANCCRCYRRISGLQRSNSSYAHKMPPTIQPFMADEELGKKNDDHRPRQRPLRRPSWRTPRPRRLLLAVVGLYLLYLFFKNMPTDLTPAPERYNPELARARQKGQTPPSNPSPGVPPQDAPPRDETVKDIDKNKDGDYYDGDISLSHLMASLGRLPKPGPEGPLFSRAVVFAGSNLASISDLIPLACQMAVRKKNIVHFVIMGRDEVSIEGIRQVNAVNNDNCPVLWHGMFLISLSSAIAFSDCRYQRWSPR